MLFRVNIIGDNAYITHTNGKIDITKWKTSLSKAKIFMMNNNIEDGDYAQMTAPLFAALKKYLEEEI